MYSQITFRILSVRPQLNFEHCMYKKFPVLNGKYYCNLTSFTLSSIRLTVSELLKSIPSSVADMLRASAAAGAPPQSVMSSEPPRRREPSGTSEAFQHPGPT